MSDQVKMTTMNYDKDRPKAENPIKIMDLSLRDGHQSLFATRGRTEDMIPVAEKMDQSGVLGGGDLGRRHLRHHAPLSQRRPLGAHPHAETLFQEDPLFHAAARPEPGGLPQLRRRCGQRLHGPLL
jgi:hypothetical protein